MIAEQDRAIAEEVMGWYYDDPGVYGMTPPVWRESGGGATWLIASAFQPSTQIHAAWQVVEHLATQGITPVIDHEVRGQQWVVTFHDLHSEYEQVRSESVCDAICRASLSTVRALRASGVWQ